MRLNRLVTTTLFTFAASAAWAGPPSGYDVAKKADEMQNGYEGETIDSIMELYDPSGKMTVQYKMKQFVIEAGKDNDNTTKSLIRFIAPPDSQGTALLTHEKKGADETRWLYLAETRQVKQIGGGSKSASFKGSEISYEDMNTETLDKYEYNNLGEEVIDGRKTWKIESKPKFQDSGYSKVLNWYDQEHYYVVKGEFYDKSGALLKSSAIKGWKQFQGKWRAQFSEITNVQTKRKTIMKNGNFKLHVKLSDKMFTVSQLQKN